MSNLVQTDLSAENTFTDYYSLGEGDVPIFVITEGTWVGTLTVQIRYPGRTTPIDMPDERFTTNFDIPAVNLPIGAEIRVGFKTGEYTSGTASIDITK